MGLIWAKGEAGASLLATCDAEKSREAFRFAPNKEGGSGGVGGWQADAGVCVCMYVCVCERERESVCVYVCVCVCMYIYTQAQAWA